MSILEKFQNKLVNLLFPFAKRFSLAINLIFLAAILSTWTDLQLYWQIRILLIWIWFVNNEIYWAGTMERDFLPIQPGSGPFYSIYRFINVVFPLFLLIFLVIMLIPVPLWLKTGFCGAFILGIFLQAIGDLKYRPKKPEE